MCELVSIIIPVYKVEKYLDRCVESVVNQTYSNLEIILVDDGSPDNCPQMCDDWAAKDERIKVIHKENAGIGMARNSGIEIATGSYLMFVDSDDYLSENAVEILYSRITEDESDLAIAKHADVNENGVLNDSFCHWMKNEVVSAECIFGYMGRQNRIPVVAWNKLYMRSVFEGIRYPALSCGEDCWTFSDIIEKCNKISIVAEVAYYYFQRSDSILHQKTDKRQLDDIWANLKLAHYLHAHGYHKGAARWYEISLDKAMKLKEKKDALRVFGSFFSDIERKELFREAHVALRMKWICLHIPFLYPLLRTAKQILKRGRS